MEQQVVRLEIGKVLAVVITVIAIALVANAFIQSDYFKGSAVIELNGVKVDKSELRTACGNEPNKNVDRSAYDTCVEDFVSTMQVIDAKSITDMEVSATEIDAKEATTVSNPETIESITDKEMVTMPEMIESTTADKEIVSTPDTMESTIDTEKAILTAPELVEKELVDTQMMEVLETR